MNDKFQVGHVGWNPDYNSNKPRKQHAIIEDQTFACNCREALMAESMQTYRRVIDWRSQSDEGLRLRCGELTAQEIRTVRAVLNAILSPDKQCPPPNRTQ
jgi:hypothetical protein